MKLVLYIYELMSGLKINFSKSEVILINGDNDLCSQYAELFNCQVGAFPIKYLGVPVSPGKLHVKDWVQLEEKMKRNWQFGRANPYPLQAELLSLIQVSLTHSYTICPCIFSQKPQLIHWTNKGGPSFGKGGHKRKYHLVRWEVINKSKKYGGLGIKNIRIMNISLLCKWWWKLEKEDGLWQQIIWKKNTFTGTLSSL